MRIALFTVLDDRFLIGYTAFIKSLLFYNEWFAHDLVVLDGGLSAGAREVVMRHYSRVRFVRPNKKRYSDVNMEQTADRLKSAYFKLDAFALRDYDRVVQFDMDMVVLGDVSEVFNCDAPIAACRAYNGKLDILADTCNSGMFVINTPYLNDDTYAGLLAAARRGYSTADQKTLNAYFAGRWHWLPKVYNVEKRMMTTKKFKDDLKNARVLHYVADKPWQQKTSAREAEYEPLEKLWWDAYERR